jgi:uncharacterized NAD-dependent epimerase/dehydratase family protein
MQLNLATARLTNPEAKFIGVSINTSQLDSAKAEAYLAEVEELLDLPTVDPVRTGVSRLVDNLPQCSLHPAVCRGDHLRQATAR